MSQRNSPLPSALVSCAGRHEPVAAYADFLIQVLEIKCYFNNVRGFGWTEAAS